MVEIEKSTEKVPSELIFAFVWLGTPLSLEKNREMDPPLSALLIFIVPEALKVVVGDPVVGLIEKGSIVFRLAAKALDLKTKEKNRNKKRNNWDSLFLITFIV